MNLRILNDDIALLGKETKDPELKQQSSYGSSSKSTLIDIDNLRPDTIPHMIAFFKKRNGSSGAGGVLTDSNMASRLESFIELTQKPEGTMVRDVHSIVASLRNYIGPSAHHWLFKEAEDGHLLPWYVSDIKYHKAEKYSPEQVRVTMKAYRRTETDERTIAFYKRDLPATAFDLLASAGYYLEKNDTVVKYNEEVGAWKLARKNTGTQMSAIGVGLFTTGRWGGISVLSMVRNGEPTKVVIDDEENEEDNKDSRSRRSTSIVHTDTFWDKFRAQKKAAATEEGEEEEEDTGSIVLPPHPYIRTFDLDKHLHCEIHVNNLEEYKWDAGLIDKLVLPEDTKDLVEILITGTSLQLTDIVRGKMPGVIVIAVGDPGTGKTLTAEVMSEQIRLPLYPVQCSQLGTDEGAVEKNLKLILDRATRWNAILLIDEADVYIRERGIDIQQNAIVGIFLRVLEYYRGVLFLTSNMATQLDDAIVSRATAYIRYERPNKDELSRIWAILSEHYGAKFSEEQISNLVDTFPTITGRNVRSLLKLAGLLAKKRGVDITVDLIIHIARFQHLASGASSLPEKQVLPTRAVTTGRNQSSISGDELKRMMKEFIEGASPEESISTSSIYTGLAKQFEGENVFNIKTRIGTEIKAFAEQGIIHLHSKGRGSVPDIYKKGAAQQAS